MDLTNHFLIAMPSLEDSNFHRTVTLLCAHNEDGAMGIVINRPLELKLGKVLEDLEIKPTSESASDAIDRFPVVEGGPVQRERGFVIHQPTGEWESTLRVGNDIGIATSRDILKSIANGQGPDRALIALGYAGWAAGQLEHEVLNNAWLSGPADSSIIFDTPYDERWAGATRLLGVDPSQLVGGAGHG
jgi:putative transcriptional regulator